MDYTKEELVHMEYTGIRQFRPMAASARAAQFSSFDALSGLKDEMGETARITETAPEFTEETQAELNRRLCLCCHPVLPHPPVRLTWFCRDGRKSGGRFLSATGVIRRIDEAGRQILFEDGRSVPLDDVTDVTPLTEEESP